MNTALRSGVLAAAAAATLVLAACSPTNEQPQNTSPAPQTSDAPAPAELSGNLQGAGASSQEAAMDAWRAGFQATHGDVSVGYDPVGSGGGKEQFLSGAVPFAGSDGLLSEEEYALAVDRCDGEGGAIHLPMYISPVAVVFNVAGVDSLNLSAEQLAKIFNGDITNWSDASIVGSNPGVDLPNATITVVYRSDSSGTTENFTEYLGKVAADAWEFGKVKEFPETAAQRVGAEKTSGMVDNVASTNNSIGYADLSRAGDLGVVSVLVGDTYVVPSPEAAANIVAASPLLDVANGANDLAYKIDRTTTDASAYPITLVSYHIICQQYDDANERALVTEFLKYVASSDGQAAAAGAAGSAPLSAALSARVTGILAEIAAKG